VSIFSLVTITFIMGVNQSKGSVDISSTPNKGPAGDNIIGKKAIVDEIIDEKTQVINGKKHLCSMTRVTFCVLNTDRVT
jgi:hypothetical protein